MTKANREAAERLTSQRRPSCLGLLTKASLLTMGRTMHNLSCIAVLAPLRFDVKRNDGASNGSTTAN